MNFNNLDAAHSINTYQCNPHCFPNEFNQESLMCGLIFHISGLCFYCFGFNSVLNFVFVSSPVFCPLDLWLQMNFRLRMALAVLGGSLRTFMVTDKHQDSQFCSVCLFGLFFLPSLSLNEKVFFFFFFLLQPVPHHSYNPMLFKEN